MTTEIIPLGTASAIPTRDRHLSAVALVRGGRTLLFDCGEGTQLQMIRAGVKPMRLQAVFISHFHGDHFYGLFGLLATLALLKRSHALTVVGPQGIADLVGRIPGLEPEWLPYPVDFVEMAPTMSKAIVLESSEYRVEARPLEHREFAAGFRFEEKRRPGRLRLERAHELGVKDYVDFRLLKQGKAVTSGGRRVEPDEVLDAPPPPASFAYVGDTRPCEAGEVLARGVDLLYHEATFGSEMADRARETGHSTAAEAARIAARSGARRLLIGHFSARYDDPARLVEEARVVFKNTDAADELKRYPLQAVEPAAGERPVAQPDAHRGAQ